MRKFGRNYRLKIDSPKADDGTVTQTVIEYPLTIRFTIKRSVSATLNSMDLIIYNLSESTRNALFQDRATYTLNTTGAANNRRVILEAGYGNDLAVVFQGSLYEASHARSGSDIITVINARDGGFDTQRTMTNRTLAGPVDLRDVAVSLMGDFPSLNQGRIGAIEQLMKRNVVLNGNTFELLNNYFPGKVFIDLEKVNILGNNEVFSNDSITVIDATTGLLETPRRENATISVRTLFEPRIQMGQRVLIQSSVQSQYDGVYRVNSINHQGIISGAQNGECQSTIGLIIEGQLFGKFRDITSTEKRVSN